MSITEHDDDDKHLHDHHVYDHHHTGEGWQCLATSR
jgi:hypothetical protein